MTVLRDVTGTAGDPASEDARPAAVILDGVTRVFRSYRRRGATSIGAAVGGVIVLDNVTLTVPAGQTVALTGPVGSGKSTLLDVIAGIERPDAGTVTVGGVRPATLSTKRAAAFRQRIGFVSGDSELVTALTVVDNVVLPLLFERGAALPRRADRHRRASELLDAVGLGRLATTRLDRLSADQRRRVAVARAMVNRPALVLADEPTYGLDRESATEVLDDLLRLVGQQGSTLILATRDDTVAVRCRRVVALRDGSIADDHLDNTSPSAVRRWIDRPAPLL